MCSFQKFGFCKFKGYYKKGNLAQIWEDLQEYKGINIVEKGIQKPDKKYALLNGCTHSEKCAYNHDQVTQHDKERDKLKEKVERLTISLA